MAGGRAGRKLVNLRTVVPKVPSEERDREILDADLRRMGCGGLRNRPWCVRDEKMVRELIEGTSNEWDNTIRAAPKKWTEELWRGTYDFAANGEGMCSRGESFIEGRFRNKPDPKDGLTVADCTDVGTRRVLEFLVPIFYPERPSKTTNMLASTIIGSYIGKRRVAWGRVLQGMVEKLATGVGKARPTPIGPFLFHLYHSQGLLREQEETAYKTAKVLDSHGWESEAEPDEEPTPGSDEDTESEEEIPLASARKRRKQTERSEASPPVRKRKTTLGSAEREEEDAFTTAEDGIHRAREGYEWLAGILKEACRITGVNPGGLCEHLEQNRKRGNVQELEERIAQLEDSNRKLKKSVAWPPKASIRANESVVSAARVLHLVENSGDVLVKAKLFDVSLGKVSEASGKDLKRFGGVMVEYQAKMERILGEIRCLNDRIFRVAGRGKGKVSEVTPPADTEQEPAKTGTEPEGGPDFTTPVTDRSERRGTRSRKGKAKQEGEELGIVIREQVTPEPRAPGRQSSPQTGTGTTSTRKTRSSRSKDEEMEKMTPANKKTEEMEEPERKDKEVSPTVDTTTGAKGSGLEQD